MSLPAPPPWRNPNALRVAAYAVVVAAGSWWLLGQLAVVLRPMLLAVFLGYVLYPWYARLRRNRVPAAVALAVLAGAAAGLLVAVTAAAVGNLQGLTADLPAFRGRAVDLLRHSARWVNDWVPWAVPVPADARPPEDVAVEAAADLFRRAANDAAGGLVEVAAAGLYLLFLLLGAERLPARVRAAYPPDQADRILHVAGRVNAAIIAYLRAKGQSGLILAVPVGLVLAAFGVRFAVLWAVLTFLCNFIPYAGSAAAYLLPVGFALLQFDAGGTAVAVAAVLLGMHVLSATFVEPMLLGRAVGLSPLVILAALAGWGQLWGLPGMFLAVPLTVVAKLVLEHVGPARPLAALAED
jgi:AI-2 transport protein TqsA